MSTTLTIFLSLLSLVGVIIGAALHYFFTKSGERQKHLEALRNQAYVDYMRGVALAAKIDGGDIRKRVEILAEVADAKTRICMYGSSKVIRTLSDLERGGSVLDNAESIEKILRDIP